MSTNVRNIAARMALAALSLTARPTLPHMFGSWSRARIGRPVKPRRNAAGSKIARKAADGKLTMRAPGGVVSQTFRDIQQRNFIQGANT